MWFHLKAGMSGLETQNFHSFLANFLRIEQWEKQGMGMGFWDAARLRSFSLNLTLVEFLEMHAESQR